MTERNVLAVVRAGAVLAIEMIDAPLFHVNSVNTPP